MAHGDPVLPGPPGAVPGSPAAAVLRAGAAAVAVLVVAWLSFTRGGWVPFLSGVDLGVHEFGHMVVMWAPALWVSLAGSLVQVAAPAGLAAYFWWRRDRLAVVMMVAWTGMSLNNVSAYIHDATRMELALFGDDGSGAGHDWHTILGELGWLDHTDAIAGSVRFGSAMAFAAALGLVAWFARGDLRRPAPGDRPLPEWGHLPRRRVGAEPRVLPPTSSWRPGDRPG
jgi:hypothetical protein